MLKTMRMRTFGTKFKAAAAATALAVLAGVAFLTTPASAQELAVQVCAGESSASSGTWTFSAGTGAFPPPGTSGICSFAKSDYFTGPIPPTSPSVPPAPSTPPVASGDMDPFDNVFWAGGAVLSAFCSLNPNNPICIGDSLSWESLGASSVNLTGTGDFSCANGGNGTLQSPTLAAEQAGPSGQNIVSTGVGYPDIINTAHIVWVATFAKGVGQLAGALYGTTPQPVSGIVIVNCIDPTGGVLPNTFSVLVMPDMPTT